MSMTGLCVSRCGHPTAAELLHRAGRARPRGDAAASVGVYVFQQAQGVVWRQLQQLADLAQVVRQGRVVPAAGAVACCADGQVHVIDFSGNTNRELFISKVTVAWLGVAGGVPGTGVPPPTLLLKVFTVLISTFIG